MKYLHNWLKPVIRTVCPYARTIFLRLKEKKIIPMTTDITLINQVCLLILTVFSVFMIAPSLGCDKRTQYTVRNMTSGEFKLCKPVHPCRPNHEPKIPAGSDIDIHQRVGADCSPCQTGTHSPGGTGPCKICMYTKCFAHQVVEGVCPDHNNHDSSSCMDKCKKGYIMNSQRSACELEKKANTTSNATSNPTPPATMSNPTTTPIRSPTTPANTTTPTSNPTTTPTMNNPTTTPTSNPITIPRSNPTTTPTINNPTTTPRSYPTTPVSNPTTPAAMNNPTTTPTSNPSTKPTTNHTAIEYDSSMSTGAIVGTILGVLLLIGIIATVVYCIKRRDARDYPEFIFHRQHSVRADAEQGENERFIQEDSSNPVNRALIIANERFCMGNDCVQSSTETLTGQRRPPQTVVNGRNCSWQPTDTSIQLSSQQQPSNTVPSFGNMPYHVTIQIDETFETHAGARNWRDLAAWLNLSLNDVKRIENMDFKTRTVLETWMTKTGNDVSEFVKILRKNQMTALADAISSEVSSLA